MKKYFNVSFQYSESVYCFNVRVIETQSIKSIQEG